MENASEALLIAFAVLIFVVAISVTFSSISQAKATSDIVLYTTDKTNYYEHVKSSATEGRIVGLDTVVSMLYRCSKESFAVEVIEGSDKYIFDTDKMTKNNEDSKPIYEGIKEFIKDRGEDTYLENFTEVVYSGIYETADDGTTITITPGGTKIYVIYTKKQDLQEAV